MCLSMSTKTEISEHDYRMTKSTLSFLFLNLDYKSNKETYGMWTEVAFLYF